MQTLTTGKIIAIIVGLVALGGAGYLIVGSPSGSAPTSSTPTSRQVNDDTKDIANTVKKGSFKDLLGMAGSQKCTVSQSSDISKSSGVFYLSGGKGRGDFESTVVSGPGAGVAVKSAMLMNSDAMYAWDVATKQGMKMLMGEIEKMQAQAPTDAPQAPKNSAAEQFNQTYDYDCQKWSADPSLFVVPTDVTFMDMAEMMQGLPNMGTMQKDLPKSPAPSAAPGMPKGMDMSAMCGSCDQAGDQRDACRAALGCK